MELSPMYVEYKTPAFMVLQILHDSCRIAGL